MGFLRKSANRNANSLSYNCDTVLGILKQENETETNSEYITLCVWITQNMGFMKLNMRLKARRSPMIIVSPIRIQEKTNIDFCIAILSCS